MVRARSWVAAVAKRRCQQVKITAGGGGLAGWLDERGEGGGGRKRTVAWGGC